MRIYAIPLNSSIIYSAKHIVQPACHMYNRSTREFLRKPAHQRIAGTRIRCHADILVFTDMWIQSGKIKFVVIYKPRRPVILEIFWIFLRPV